MNRSEAFSILQLARKVSVPSNSSNTCRQHLMVSPPAPSSRCPDKGALMVTLLLLVPVPVTTLVQILAQTLGSHLALEPRHSLLPIRVELSLKAGEGGRQSGTRAAARAQPQAPTQATQRRTRCVTPGATKAQPASPFPPAVTSAWEWPHPPCLTDMRDLYISPQSPRPPQITAAPVVLMAPSPAPAGSCRPYSLSPVWR